MVKKFLPIILIISVWFIFAKPFFIDDKIPFPADLKVNQYTLWSSYEKFWSPIKNPAQPDIIDQILPWKKLTIDSLKKQQIPYWNPYSFSGTPHLANYQSSSFSVSNIFYFLFSFNSAWSLAVLVQPLLAGIFTFLFTRSLKRSEFASIISAVSFMFSAFITTWMGYTTLGLAISFLPLGLFAVEKYTLNHKAGYLLLLTLIYPLSFFSGHFQISIYLTIFILSYIFFKYIELKNKKDLLNLLLFSFLGLLLALPQILPTIEFYFSSVRSSIFQKIEAVSLKYLLTAYAPDYYGNPVTRNVYFGNYIEWSSFSGSLTFLLAIFAIFKRNKYVLFFIITSFVSLLLSLDSFITDFIVKLNIPVISTSALGRVLVIFSFSISVLAAFGFDLLINELKTKRRKLTIKWFLICSILLSVIWILTIGKIIDPQNYQIAVKNLILPTSITLIMFLVLFISFINKKFIKLAVLIILFLIIFDMLRFSTKWQVFSEEKLMFPDTPIINKMQTLDNTYRVLGGFGAEGSVYFGFPSTEGYDPLYINRYGQLIATLEDGKIKSSPRSGVVFNPNSKYAPNLIDLLGVKYILEKNLDENEVWGFPFEKYPEKFIPIYKEKDFTIYENGEVLPRAFIVGSFNVIENDQRIISKMLSAGFDFSKTAILETEPNLSTSPMSSGSAKIISYDPNKITIDAYSENESILLLTDNFYPGWKAKINGEESKVYRTNYTFRSVVVPKGKSRVEFYFESDSFNLAVKIAVFSGIIIFIITAGKWYTTKKQKIKKKK